MDYWTWLEFQKTAFKLPAALDFSSSFGFLGFRNYVVQGNLPLCSNTRRSCENTRASNILGPKKLEPFFQVPGLFNRIFKPLTNTSNFFPQNQKSQQPKKDDSKAHRLLNSSVWRVGSSVRGHRKCDTTRLRSVQSPGFTVGVLEGTTCFQATQVSGSSRGIGWRGDSGVSEMCVFFLHFFCFDLGETMGFFVQKKQGFHAVKAVKPPPRKVGIPRGISDLKREAKMGFARFWSTFQNSSCLVGRQIRSSILL